MAANKRFKAINFDLNTASLRALFGEEGRAQAYRRIQSFLKAHGFEHRQGSGYRSTIALSDLDVTDLVVDMYKSLEWLPRCVRRLDVTNIGRDYDLDAIAKRQLSDEQKPFEIPLPNLEA